MTAPGTVAVSTLGCRLNQVESQEILALFETRGFRPAGPDERAQVHVVNTCTVTGRADFSDRQTIRRIARDNPGAVLVVTGCYAQTDAEAVARIPGVDWVVGNREKAGLLDVLDGLDKRARPEIRVGDVRAERALAPAPLVRRAGRSRAFVKIQDGCQHRCAFCIVPAARGDSRSQSPAAVIEQVEALVGAGYREITLTGVDIGHYGRDLAPSTALADLVARVAAVPGLRWLRLSSILPAYWSDALIATVAGTPAVVPHLHLPLQSGSDRVLKLMRRPYNLALYRALVDRLAAAIPDLGLGTDLIVGHPGEAEEDLQATLDVVASLPLSYLHVFSYSDRKGTEAARRDGHVPPRDIRERSARVRALGREKNLAFRRGLVGRRLDVLVLEERDRETGFLTGLTPNYVEVLFDGPAGLARGFARVRVTAAGTDRTFAVMEEAHA